jgi:pyruvate ferredoxin oxidoreductase beta subunit
MAETAIKVNIKELAKKPQLLAGGHRLCAGCIAPVVVRQVLMAADYPVVVANATGCLEVGTSIYPYTSWMVPWFHSAFENAAATISGVEAMYQSLKKQGKIPPGRKIKFIAFGGDGGTYDIGLQSLSGAVERGHDFLYVCYDNGAYMNTGIQRSSSTPMGASATTAPAGKVIPGKLQPRKDLTAIMAAHANLRYAAQASPANWRDLAVKVKKALNVDGPAFLNVISTCHRGWRSKPDESIEILRLAVDTCFWPLYEIEGDRVTINYTPKEKKPVADWLKLQGRFKHLFRPGMEELLGKIQAEVDHNWNRLRKLSEIQW